MIWFELAAQLTDAEKKGPRNDDGQTWLSILSDKTGNNQTMLRKMQKARAFVIDNFDEESINALSMMPLSYVDIFSRIYGIKRDAAISLANEVISNQGRFTYRSLLARFDEIRNSNINIVTNKIPHKSGVFHFKKRCFEIAIKGGMDGIYQHHVQYHQTLRFRIWKGAHPFVSPHMTCRLNGIYSQNKLVSNIDAFDCYMQYKDEIRDNPRDRILRSISEATFFTRLWIMLPHQGDHDYEDLLGQLGPTNVGIVRVNTDENICKCNIVPTSIPIPDRRGMWSAHQLEYTA